MVVVLGSAALLTAAGCWASSNPRLHPGASVWFEGPVRWLMLPEELKDFRRLSGNDEALRFIEEFWRRRDPTPGDGENPFRTAFFERAGAADRLYQNEGVRGSLTDRGGVLVLFCSPSVLRYRQVSTPVLAPGKREGAGASRSRWLTQEIWSYRPEELPSGFDEQLEESERGREILFVFAAEARRTYLLEGENYLKIAARASVRRP